jgi:hypothetical protein
LISWDAPFVASPCQHTFQWSCLPIVVSSDRHIAYLQLKIYANHPRFFFYDKGNKSIPNNNIVWDAIMTLAACKAYAISPEAAPHGGRAHWPL